METGFSRHREPIRFAATLLRHSLGAAMVLGAIATAATVPAVAQDDAKPAPSTKRSSGKADTVPGTKTATDAKPVAGKPSPGTRIDKSATKPVEAKKLIEAKKPIEARKPAVASRPAAPAAPAAPASTGTAAPSAPARAAANTTPKPKTGPAPALPDGVPFSMQMPAATTAASATAQTTPSASGVPAGSPATTGALPPPSSMPVGKVTGLPVPRYASLKTDRVNLREGPSKDNRTSWVFQRAGLPVEIVAEYETWRRIRDSAGTEGWVLHSLLSGRRTALIMPWAKTGTDALPLLRSADDKADMVAQLQPNVIASVKGCKEGWCRVAIVQPGTDVSGFMRQDKLWGVYPNEKVE